MAGSQGPKVAVMHFVERSQPSAAIRCRRRGARTTLSDGLDNALPQSCNETRLQLD